MIEKEIIKDEKETIHRLQEECMEKTEIIEEMNKVIQDCNIQRVRLYKALEEIRGMTKAVRYFPQERFVLIRAKINEVLEK